MAVNATSISVNVPGATSGSTGGVAEKSVFAVIRPGKLHMYVTCSGAPPLFWMLSGSTFVEPSGTSPRFNVSGITFALGGVVDVPVSGMCRSPCAVETTSSAFVVVFVRGWYDRATCTCAVESVASGGIVSGVIAVVVMPKSIVSTGFSAMLVICTGATPVPSLLSVTLRVPSRPTAT